ncbi:uncharacterized SAM-binding protein YcdF (DUF218 family) [Roseibium hamelinense]|uniref:Uncharacterized SAM-binding protein YcdF (DUF218 family) n=1 Tax=Roseibium hamelinense TaxID=150831 RepID=A0A562SN68_9HYPH|nr:YdcF family protein [Roseibium hamelinense]TWI82749.1 uncharacterized SAM-binding protein YcdF (DUF218 family) [Roseibium hamelinense]
MSGSSGQKTAPVARKFRNRKRLFLGLCAIAFAGAIVFKFVSFANRVSNLEVPHAPSADAIVVLTGGTERVQHAIQLLNEGRAERLLISGVHPGTTPEQIAILTKADMPLLSCCVDLDRAALNTEGNASETASWAKDNGFTSLILVTSAYHLPRAQIELSSVMPGVELVAYPVFNPGLHLNTWYSSPRTIRLLIREYSKYTLARFRLAARQLLGAIGL